MKSLVVLLGVLLSAAQAAAATERQPESCTDIRARIAAQTGVLARPDIAMVETVGARPDCRFTSAEVFRAAYGDRPMPESGRHGRDRHHKRHHDDD